MNNFITHRLHESKSHQSPCDITESQEIQFVRTTTPEIMRPLDHAWFSTHTEDVQMQ